MHLNVLFVLFICASAAESLHIDPSKLFVATVLDLADPDMLRDSMTLFRSIRLHGGLLNQATVVCYIVIEKSSPFANDTIIDDLMQLNISIDFIIPAPSHVSRTMNKFAAFTKFDTHFDYMLWLDSDIVIFNDPVPHMLPVEMQCVPAMYNYLIRFPHVNSTHLVHNPALPNFTLIGDNVTAPHGVCNTGVMLFSRAVVQQLLAAFPSVATDIDALNPFKKDRFLDSLYFVVAVNRLSILITPWNFTMNYQSFFEAEILELTNTTELAIGHFITHTMFRCYLNEENVCICFYANDYIPPNSLIKRETELKMLPRDACLVMAGLAIPVALSLHPEPTVQPLAHANMPYCAIDYPTASTVIAASEQVTRVPIAVRCELHRDMFTAEAFAPLEIVLFDSTTQSVMWATPIQYACNRVSSCSMLENGVLQMRTILHADVDVSSVVNVSVTFADLSVDPAIVQLEYSLVFQIIRGDMSADVHNHALSYPGITSLDSQMNLYRLLNARKVSGSGFISCCDTARGLAVSKLLIEKWRGDVVVVVIRSLPPDMSLERVLSDIYAACASSAHVSCVLSQSKSWYRRGFASYTVRRDAIYIDHYSTASEAKVLLTKMHSSLRPQGILLGSRFLEMDTLHYPDRYSNYAALIDVNAIVALRSITNFYVTYNEKKLTDVCVNAFECAPAWYLVKS